MINVTKTFVPPWNEYEAILKRAWRKEWLTNNGELYQELVTLLTPLMGGGKVIPMCNGTLPIQIALKVLGEKDCEIITTPFSYVATTSSIVWEGFKPVFVDIDQNYLTIDENLLVHALTPQTRGILATHVFGNPCNIEAIESFAKANDLFVIYDAAHCFGVKYKGKSVFSYGDVSTCSFHATKVFHTGEGGALVSNKSDRDIEFWYSHNFGHDGPERFHGLGINAKMSELQAAMGLTVLPHMDSIFAKRRLVCAYYDEHLNDFNLKKMKLRENTNWNYSYYPILFETEDILLRVKAKLNSADIWPRRYFYPSLDTLPYLEQEFNCPKSRYVSKTIMCLPLYESLDLIDVKKIVRIVNSVS